jgi:hypothetical protein
MCDAVNSDSSSKSSIPQFNPSPTRNPRKLPKSIKVTCHSLSRANSEESCEEDDSIHDKLSSAHLKLLCTKYGLKTTGTKPVMAVRARTYCMESHFSTRLQRVFRGHVARAYIRRHMLLPECARASDFVNDTDFYTMDEFDELSHCQLFTFKDDADNKLYRCNMASFFKLMKSAFTTKEKLSAAANGLCCEVPSTATNPYTRVPISLNTVRSFFNKLRLCRILKYSVYTEFKEDALTPQQALDARILDVFQDINKLGNYADSEWFSSLQHQQYVWFIQELYDIWAYRAELSTQVKMQICPPYGQMFPSVTNGIVIIHEMRTAPFQRVREVCISTCERLVRNGVTHDDRYLGASYVLSALTLVSPKAREALPWLYQSVAAGSPTVAAGAPTGPRAVANDNISNIIHTINNTFNNNNNNNNNMYIGVQDDIDDTILYNILTAMNINTYINHSLYYANAANANPNANHNHNQSDDSDMSEIE